MAYRTHYPTTTFGHDVRRIFFQRHTKHIVCRQEEPILLTLLNQRTGSTASHGRCVIRIVDGVWGAFFICQSRCTGTDSDKRLFLFRSHLGHGQAGCGVGTADQQIHALLVEPLARLAGCDVCFILMVCRYKFNFLAVDLVTKIRYRHLDGFCTCRTIDVSIDTGHIGDKTNLDGITIIAAAGVVSLLA